MHSVLLKDGFSVARTNARLRIENSLDLQRLFRTIDADPAIVGAGVVYIDSDLNVITLRDFQPICSVSVKRVILREAPRHMAPQQFARELEMNPQTSRIAFEGLGLVLSCAGALIAWSLVGSGAALTVFSGGASVVFVYVGHAAATATTLQCLNALARTTFEMVDPELNEWLDSEEWYQIIFTVLDAISLAGVTVSMLSVSRLFGSIKSSTGKGLRSALRGLSRQERLKLTDDLLRIRDPRLTAQLLKLRKLAGDFPKRYTMTQLRQGTLFQIKDCIGAGLGVAGSALSGNINTIAIGIYSELVDES